MSEERIQEAELSTTTTTTEESEATEETADETDRDDEQVQAAADGGSETDESGRIAEMTSDELADAFTVRELRDELRDRDLTVRGKKAVLIDRLKEHAGDD